MTNKAQASQQTTPITTHFQCNYTVEEVISKAQGQWPYILERLGIDSSYLKNKHGPCPICGGKDRFRFNNKAGTGSFYCNHCGAGYAIKLLLLVHQWDFRKAIDEVAKILNISTGSYSADPIHISKHLERAFEGSGLIELANENVQKQRKKLKETWDQALFVSSNDPVFRYLKARGVLLNDIPNVLRFHPKLGYYDTDHVFIGNFPAMLALVQNEKNELITLHRTYLGDDCKADIKNPKKLMSAIYEGATRGAAIKLYKPINGKLALAEGIETALAFHTATQIPVWATVSATGMESIIIPDDVTEVIIAIDNDVNRREQTAASKLSKRLLSEGRIVTRLMPSTVGYDFADLLAEENQ